MKYIPMLLLLVAMAACSSGNNAHKRFAGTYVRVMETEFNTLYDTIRITPSGASAPLVYHVSNDGLVVDKADDTPALPNRKTSKRRTGTFDETKNAMIIDEVPYVLNDKDELTNGKIVFTRCADCR